jgi:hypothetical protein
VVFKISRVQYFNAEYPYYGASPPDNSPRFDAGYDVVVVVQEVLSRASCMDLSYTPGSFLNLAMFPLESHPSRYT